MGTVLMGLFMSCGSPGDGTAASGSAVDEPLGNAGVGRDLVRRYGCVACHRVPGSTFQNVDVGPPLNRWARRQYIAGVAPNTPDLLVRWITMPQALSPGTAMPNLGVSDDDARDMAAYLYTLR